MAEAVDAHLEYVEGQLNRLIEDRSRAAQAERERAEMWRASVRRYHRSRTARLREEWRQHFLRLAEVHARLAAENEAKATQLTGEEGEGG